MSNRRAGSYDLELEITFCVVVGDVSYHLSDKWHLAGWQYSHFNIMPNHAAKASAEVFMSRIGEERTAVGQHAHKTAEQPLQGECVHLALHAIELIVEPPSAAKLNLPCLWSLLEVAYHGGQHLIVGGIDAVENGLCQHALTV